MTKRVHHPDPTGDDCEFGADECTNENHFTLEADPLQLSISTTMEVNLGDHGERHTTVHEYIKGESVEDLVYRVFTALKQGYRQHNPTDKITIKVMVGADGSVTGDVPIQSRHHSVF